MGVVVAGQLVTMQFGGVDVLVQAAPQPGTQATSRAGDAVAKAVDILDEASDAIVRAAAATADTVTKLATQAARPAKLEVEFGLGFTATGKVIIASGTVGATLKIVLTYEAADRPTTGPASSE